MTQKSLAKTYPRHLATLTARYDEALAANGYDAVLIGAGSAARYFMDDQHAPFRCNPQLMQWLPLDSHPLSCLQYEPGKTPVVWILRPESFWEEAPAVPGAPWSEHLELRVLGQADDLRTELAELPARCALLGPADQWQHTPVPGDRNPERLVKHLHFQRAWKTDFEIACLREATARAVRGHRAAAAAYAEGASEFATLLAYQGGCEQQVRDMPYPPIIGMGPHAAVLHYQHYRRGAPGASLLIDAGCTAHGYASDITRTHVAEGHAEFRALRDALDEAQQALCGQLRPGVPFGELHHAAHQAIARILTEQELISGSAEATLESGITRYFFPHGLGHLLGLQVHDVAGHQADAGGGELEPPAAYPKLRLLRRLEPGFTLTMEPGIYFIESLLGELRGQPEAAAVNWSLVENLRACGGIRIEDDVLVTADGHVNLTREAFAEIV